MRVLPERTLPPDTVLGDLHAPPPAPSSGDYSVFRRCLRWEFGFTCAYCLAHEAGLVEHGAEGTGLTWIEHVVRQGAEPGLKGRYENVTYACRYCNRARGTRDLTDEQGRTLLSPRTSAWADRFRLAGDDLELVDPEDADAVYTRDAYDINDSRKQTFRADRARALARALRVLEINRSRRAYLEAKAADPAHPDRGEAIDLLEALDHSLDRARRDLRRFQVVPSEDAPEDCRCEPAVKTLPAYLSKQARDV